MDYQHASEASRAWDKRNAIKGPFLVLNLHPWCGARWVHERGLFTKLSNWQVASLVGAIEIYDISFSLLAFYL